MGFSVSVCVQCEAEILGKTIKRCNTRQNLGELGVEASLAVGKEHLREKVVIQGS